MDINLLLRGDSLNRLLGRVLPEDRLVRELLASLRPGQTLQAKVLSTPRADLAQLLIQDVRISARTGRALTPGQTLALTVLKGGDTPQLQVQQAPRPLAAEDVLRLALPRQLPLRETLSALSRVAQQALPLLPGPAKDTLRALVDRGVPVRQVSAERIQQAVRDSGIFTEARLARGQPPTPGDRKALLMQLAAALPRPTTPPSSVSPAGQATPTATGGQPDPLSRAALLGSALANTLTARQSPTAAAPAAPPGPDQAVLDRLWRLVDASIARIQSHQAASLAADDGARPAWQMEVPLLLPGGLTQAVELRIEPEQSGNEDAQSPEAGWLVTIGFVFPELGPVQAGVRLANGRISTTFWCELPSAAARFERHLPDLQAALEAAGLEVAHLAASQGKPPSGPALTPEQRLLDERV